MALTGKFISEPWERLNNIQLQWVKKLDQYIDTEWNLSKKSRLGIFVNKKGKITKLSIHSNLEILWSKISQLLTKIPLLFPDLEDLDFSFTYMEFFPFILTEFKDLCHFSLNAGSMINISNDLFQNKDKLERITLSLKLVERIPHDLFFPLKNSSLASLTLYLQSIHEFPPSLWTLSSLRTLLLINMPLISMIPPEISFLSNLSHLFLYLIPLSTLPTLPSPLPNLKHLQLKEIPIESLAPFLDQCPSLEILEITECHSLITLPPAILQLKSLRKIQISRCSAFTHLPIQLFKTNIFIEIEHCQRFRLDPSIQKIVEQTSHFILQND